MAAPRPPPPAPPLPPPPRLRRRRPRYPSVRPSVCLPPPTTCHTRRGFCAAAAADCVPRRGIRECDAAAAAAATSFRAGRVGTSDRRRVRSAALDLDDFRGLCAAAAHRGAAPSILLILTSPSPFLGFDLSSKFSDTAETLI